VEPIVIFFYVSFNASVPVMQQYVFARYSKEYGVARLLAINKLKNFGGEGANVTANGTCGGIVDQNDPIFIAQQQAQAASSALMVGLALCCVLPALISTVLLGPFSDKAGRKVALIPALIGEVIRMAGNALVVYYELPLWVMLLAFFIDGVLGSAGGVMMACFSYLADITTSKQRTMRLLILEMCMALGVIASQVAIGHMVENLGFFWPMFTITVINVINLIYAIFLLPETIERDQQARLFTMEHIKNSLHLYVVNDWKERRWKLQLCLLTFTIFTMVENGTQEVTTLYLMNSPLCVGPVFIGYFNSIRYACQNVGSILLIKTMYRYLGDVGLVICGAVSGIAYMTFLSQSVTLTLAFAAPAVGFGMQLVLPMIRSISSKLVEPEELGSLFATQGWMQLLATLLGSTTFNIVYGSTLFLVHGFVFMVAAGVLLISVIGGCILAVQIREDIIKEEEFESRKAAMDEYLDCRQPSVSFIGRESTPRGSFVGI